MLVNEQWPECAVPIARCRQRQLVHVPLHRLLGMPIPPIARWTRQAFRQLSVGGRPFRSLCLRDRARRVGLNGQLPPAQMHVQFDIEHPLHHRIHHHPHHRTQILLSPNLTSHLSRPPLVPEVPHRCSHFLCVRFLPSHQELSLLPTH